MQKHFLKSSIIFSVLSLAACGGGGSGGNGSGVSISDFTDLSIDRSGLTPDVTVNGASDTLSYSGYVDIAPDLGPTSTLGFIGELDVTVNFASDVVQGSAQNFGEYASPSTSGNLPSASGSLDINGSLTGANESLNSGMTGTAVGTVGGNAFNMTFDGNVLGASREGVALYFDNIGDDGGGVGIAVR